MIVPLDKVLYIGTSFQMGTHTRWGGKPAKDILFIGVDVSPFFKNRLYVLALKIDPYNYDLYLKKSIKT